MKENTKKTKAELEWDLKIALKSKYEIAVKDLNKLENAVAEAKAKVDDCRSNKEASGYFKWTSEEIHLSNQALEACYHVRSLQSLIFEEASYLFKKSELEELESLCPSERK